MEIEKEDAKTKQPPKRKVERQPKRSEQVIYAGPSLQGSVLVEYTVFRGDLPAHIQKLVDDHPLLEQLFIPASELAAFMKRAALKGTVEHRAYESARGVK